MKHETKFDKEIFELLKQGLSGPKIATAVGCSVNTVKTTVYNAGLKMPSKKITVPDEALDLFNKGFSVKSIATQLGFSRRTIRNFLVENGITPPNISEGIKRAYSLGHIANVKAAHNALRGKHQPIDGCKKRAHGISKKGKMSVDEIILFQLLANYGITTVPLYPVGIFNIDLAIPERMIAIEINGGGWHNTPRKIAQDKKKFDYLTKNGWKVFYVWTQRHRIRRDKFIPLLEILGFDPSSPIYEDGVIMRQANTYHSTRLYGKDFSGIKTVVDFKNTPELSTIAHYKIGDSYFLNRNITA